MSYILDALRKAEQARPVGKVPTIQTLHPVAPLPAKTRWWPWAAVAVGLANAAALAWIFSAPAVPPTATAASPSAALVAPGPVVAPGVVATAPATTPAPTVPPAPASETARVQSEAEAPLASVPASDPVSTARPTSPAPGFQSPQTRAPAIAPPARVPRVAKTPPVDGPAVVSPRARVDVPASAEMRETQPQRPPVPIASAAVKDEVPATFREAFPSVRLDALVYADSPAGRMAFISGRRYGEGDSLDPQTRIEEITQEGVVLRHRGQRFLLR